MNQVASVSVDDLKKQLHKKTQMKGRKADDLSLREVENLLGPSIGRRDLLIENLHVLNDALNGLPERHLVALSQLMNISMAEVYEVATFYHHFEVLRDGVVNPQITIRVCNSVSCELAGANDLLERLPKILNSAEVRVVPVPCIGRCEQAPAVVVNQHPAPLANLEKVTSLVEMKKVLHPLAKDTKFFNPLDYVEKSVTSLHDETISPDYCGLNTYQDHGGYQLLQAVVTGKIELETVLKNMEDSGLRGLGGAGFPAGRKWRIVRDQPAPRLMAVNIDEGEPGTFKDRTYLERDPHRFLEGMLIAAHVVGIQACYIYLRDEYHGCRAILEKELAKLQANPPCELPLIEIRRGAGAYICGEESAMIESIEGKRGEPRMRPPYIAQVGLFGRPTLEHNFETLYWVRDINQQGPAWFSGFGRNGRRGLRSFSVSGRVNYPGVKLAPAGITVQELIDEYAGGMQAGHTFYAYLPGGASGGILPASMNQIPLDFDTLQPYGCFIGSAAVMILSEADQAKDAALNVMKFFEHESCGQCTPCRVGTSKAATLMASTTWDNSTLDDLSTVMIDASICGLGQAAPNSIRCVQKYFPQEIV
jgi:formate dehydrogenase